MQEMRLRVTIVSGWCMCIGKGVQQQIDAAVLLRFGVEGPQ